MEKRAAEQAKLEQKPVSTAPTDSELAALARTVGAALAAAGLHAVTVESCTGGYVAKLLTDISGSSDWFDGGWITYSNEAKQRDVGVLAATLSPARRGERGGGARDGDRGSRAQRCGSRRRDQRRRRAHGRHGAQSGGQRVVRGGEPRRRRRASIARHEQFSGDRDAVRRHAAAVALDLLLDTR